MSKNETVNFLEIELKNRVLSLQKNKNKLDSLLGKLGYLENKIKDNYSHKYKKQFKEEKHEEETMNLETMILEEAKVIKDISDAYINSIAKNN